MFTQRPIAEDEAQRDACSGQHPPEKTPNVCLPAGGPRIESQLKGNKLLKVFLLIWYCACMSEWMYLHIDALVVKGCRSLKIQKQRHASVCGCCAQMPLCPVPCPFHADFHRASCPCVPRSAVSDGSSRKVPQLRKVSSDTLSNHNPFSQLFQDKFIFIVTFFAKKTWSNNVKNVLLHS